MRRALTLTVAAFAFFALAGTVARAETASAVTKAETLYREGKYKESLALLEVYLKANPKDATALVDRGDDYEALGDSHSAIADYTAAIGINGDFAYAYASRCDSRNELDQSRDALDDCDKAISLDPKMAYAYRVRATVHIALNDLQAALADANNAISVNSDNGYGYALRCRVYVDLGQLAKAVEDCSEAVRIDPTLSEAYFQRGRAEIKSEKWTDAIADFTQSEKLDPGPNGNYWLALARYNVGQYGDALKNVDTYIAAKSDDGDGYLLRAQLQLKLGNRDDAKAAATDALRHYRIDNDQAGATKAQALLDSINSPSGASH